VPHLPLDELAQWAAGYFATRELLHDARTLTLLGPGAMELDLLRGSCRHGNHYHPPLVMAGMLRTRIEAALRESELPWDILTQALIQVRVRLDERDPAKGYKPKNVFAGYAGLFLLCQMEITVLLATGEGSWRGAHRGLVDWPRDWARRGL
jgi:hypothetical protein